MTVIVLVPFTVESQKFGIVTGLWKIYGSLIFSGMDKHGTHMKCGCNFPFINVKLIEHLRQEHGIFGLS